MEAQIPLYCLICSRNFSDTSHLLTHIASKGHLSTYYKIKVSPTTDASGQKLIEDYDEWYARYNVENIMIERMVAKNKKKGTCKPSNVNNSSRSTPSTLDPQLGPKIKTEPMSRSATPGDLRQAITNQLFAPHMQSWPVGPYAGSSMSRETSALTSLYTATPSSDTDQTQSPLPTIKRRPKQTTITGLQININPEDNSGIMNAPLQTPKESNQLKGIVWDGMDKFDAASPETKRRRNQKKDVSVLKTLQEMSETIEATEKVFDASGVLRRNREITGNPDIDDPIKGESSPEPSIRPKKRTKCRPRKAMTKKNVNNGRATRGRGATQLPLASNTRKSTPYFADDQVDNDALTYGRCSTNNDYTTPNVHRHSMNVYRDNTAPPISFDNPAPFTTLTQGFRNPLQLPTANMGTFGQLNHNPFSFHQQPPFGVGPFHQQQQPFDLLNPFLFDDEATVSPPSER